MPSHLRVQSSFEPVDAAATYKHTTTAQQSQSTAFRRNKPSRMSLTQTYYVASTARSKLGREAARADHNLRRLVGHANMLDQLMVELSHAEAEQDAWFNGAVRAAAPEEPRRVQWIESIAEDAEDDDEDDDDSIYDDDEEDDDDDSDYEGLDDDTFNIPLRRLKSPPVSLMSSSASATTTSEVDIDMDDEEVGPVVSSHSPPELTYDDSDSDDDSLMPASPRSLSVELTDKQRSAVLYRTEAQQPLDELVMQQQQQQRQTIIAAC